MSILVLVPSPLRALRAARRLCDAQEGVSLGARATVPEGLVAGLLAAAGERRSLLTPLAERLLILESAREAGGAFAQLAPVDGSARALVAAVNELRRGELSAALMARAVEELEGGARLRLQRLVKVMEVYEGRLERLGALDRASALRAAVEALARGAVSEEVRDLDLLVVDGFAALSPATYDLVSALAHRARCTRVRLPFFPERADLSSPVEPLLRRFEAMHELAAQRDVTLALEALDGEGTRAARLTAMLGAVAGGETKAATVSLGGQRGRVHGLLGAGEEGEAAEAARWAAALLEEGFAPDDVAIVSSSPAAMAPALARAMAERGVPFATGCGAPLSEAQPIEAIRRALRVAVVPGRSALEALAGTPYLALPLLPERLGHWLDRAGVLEGERDARGDPEAALRRRAASLRSQAAEPERAALLRTAEAIAALHQAVAPLAASGRASEHAARLRAFLLHTGARRRAARVEDQDPRIARRDVAALARLDDVADDLVRALSLIGRGSEVIPASEWSALLEAAIEGATVVAHEPSGGAVELWPLSEAPGLSARAALLLGCGRGRFPVAQPPEPLLREPERFALQRAVGRAALATGGQRRAEALHAAFCALAMGREVVALGWAGPGPEGEGEAPAPLIVEALTAAGAPLPTAVACDPEPARCLSIGEALRARARSASRRSLPPEGSPEIRRRVASFLARGALEAERRAAVFARRASPAAGAIPESLAAELQRVLPEEWSPSQLELHARCPYRLFAALVLGLAEPESADLDIDPRDEGSIGHAVMERFLRRRMERGAPPLRGDPSEEQELREVAEAMFERFASDGKVGDPAAWAGRRAAVMGRLVRYVAAEAREGDEAQPSLIEYHFGGDSGVPPLCFDDPDDPGLAVKLRGRLDRVDATADRLVLIDYKDARSPTELKKKLEPEALGETNFQVPAYLMAAARALPGRRRLEASYGLLRAAARLSPFTAEVDDPLFAVKAAGAEGEEGTPRAFSQAVVAVVRGIRSGQFPIVSRDCGGCPYGAVCRAETVAEVNA